MKILVLNCGSSSIKYKLYEMDKQMEIASGGIEKIGMSDSFLKFADSNNEKRVISQEIKEHTAGIELILKTLTDAQYGFLKSLSEIDAVGHRIAHGGYEFKSSVVIDKNVIASIERLSELAPLHNPAHLKGIFAIEKIMPNIPQVAVFDTSFHQTMPDYAYMYSLPYEYYDKYAVRRYGFHGTSHKYISKRACEVMGMSLEKSRIVTVHVGNGVSITAIKDGKSVDTSMGMTPVEGLMMGTRSGDVDLGVITYLMKKENLTTEEMNDIINKKSGILGVSGVSSDMRDIEAAISNNNKRAELALEMYRYHILKYIGSYIAVLGGVDAIVFAGGVGENQPSLRRYVSDNLRFLGIEIDIDLNEKSRGCEVELSKPNSKVKVAVIPTNEELAIAMDTKELVKK